MPTMKAREQRQVVLDFGDGCVQLSGLRSVGGRTLLVFMIFILMNAWSSCGVGMHWMRMLRGMEMKLREPEGYPHHDGMAMVWKAALAAETIRAQSPTSVNDCQY